MHSENDNSEKSLGEQADGVEKEGWRRRGGEEEREIEK
jgi:hypothetical protein